MKPEFIQIRDLQEGTHLININHIVIISETKECKHVSLINGISIKTTNDVLRIIDDKTKM